MNLACGAASVVGAPCSHGRCPLQVGGRDAQLYERAGLLTQRTIMAHGVTLTDAELRLLAERGTALAHCPLSNFYFADVPLDVLRCLAAGVKVRCSQRALRTLARHARRTWRSTHLPVLVHSLCATPHIVEFQGHQGRK